MTGSKHNGRSVLVVDDEPQVTELLCKILGSAGYACDSAAHGAEALFKLALEPADLVITDVRMPGMDGLELLEQIRIHHPRTFVLMLSGAADNRMIIQAQRSGACDFLEKPIRRTELLTRVQAAESARDRMVVPAAEVPGPAPADAAVRALSEALAQRYPETFTHSVRVAESASSLAREMGLTENEARSVYLAGLLHDLGKLTMRTDVLDKPGKLDPQELEEVKSHPERAERILENVQLPGPARAAIRHHHERWDGGGYPDGLCGDEIPLGARILTVADAFDAMTSDRVYKPAMPAEEGFQRLRDGADAQFDPAVVDKFIRTRNPGSLQGV